MNFIEKLKDTEVSVGPLSFSATKGILIGAAAVAIIGLGVGGKFIATNKSADPAVTTEAVTGLVALSEDQLADNAYYIKTGDKYYALPNMTLSSSVEGDSLIPKEANGLRLGQMSEATASTIPTLYTDSEIIYVSRASENNTEVKVPTSFWLERFKDEGYSFGLSRLRAIGEKVHFINDGTLEASTIYNDSSIATQFQGLAPNSDLVIDSIGGSKLTPDKLSTSGTVKGLTEGQTYKVDVYQGTSVSEMTLAADTFNLTSYELYENTDYTYNANGYVSVNMAKDLQSGYYYINGAGLFRFVNGPASEGDKNIDFNVPYYITSENGEVTTNPAAETDSSSKDDSKDSKENTWTNTIYVDNQQKMMNVSVSYKNASSSYFDSISEPKAILVDPDGEETTLVNSEDGVLSMKVENPKVGKWVIKMTGLENKTFNTEVTFNGSTSNMVTKDGDSDVPMTVYIDKDFESGTFTFDWSETGHAATVTVKTPDGKTYTNENGQDTVSETYGKVVLAVKDIKAGEYAITLKGESLGSVHFTYAADIAPADDSAEGSSDASAEAASDDATAEATVEE